MVFRIYGIMINTIFISLIYVLFRKLKIEKSVSLLYTILITIMALGSLMNGANYNILVFVFMLIGVILQIDFKEKHKNWYYILQGILIVLTILTKQNIGILYLSGIMLTELCQKNSMKQKIINIVKILVIIAIPIAMFLIGLYQKGMIEPFLSYTVYGLTEFAEKNVHVDVFTILEFSSIVFAILAFSYFGIKKNVIKDKENLKTLLCVGIPLLFVMYPLMNYFHIIFGMLFMTITFLYLINTVLLEEMLDIKNTENKTLKVVIHVVISILITIITVYSIYHFVMWVQRIDKTKEWNDPYFGIYISEEVQEDIERITNYMLEQEQENQDVIVFSAKAALYNIPMKRSHGAMDLPYLGNFGKGGEDGMIEKIQKLTNTKILIDKELPEGGQDSRKIRDWIQENLEQQGEIDGFLIYQ